MPENHWINKNITGDAFLTGANGRQAYVLYIKVNFAYLLSMKSQNLSWYLKNVDLFRGLSAEALKAVSQIVHEKICPKKELLYSPHSEASQIYILKKGEITLYLSRAGIYQYSALCFGHDNSVFTHRHRRAKDSFKVSFFGKSSLGF